MQHFSLAQGSIVTAQIKAMIFSDQKNEAQNIHGYFFPSFLNSVNFPYSL